MKLSKNQVYDAVTAMESGSTLRAEARKLSVTHTALRKRIEKLRSEPDSSNGVDGYQPDELDKAIIRAVLDAGIPSGLERLSHMTGWTIIELLEAVKQ